MPEVYTWPPVDLIGYETTISRPGSLSYGLSRTPYYSQTQPTRTRVTAVVAGIGRDLAGNAYIEQLKALVDGKLPLVRMLPLPSAWLLAVRPLGPRGKLPLDWYSDDSFLAWTGESDALVWYSGDELPGTVGVSNGWNYVDVTGLPANTVAAFPNERVSANGISARAINLARADAGGAARVYVDSALTDGPVTIGARPTEAFLVEDWGSLVQTENGGSRSMQFIQVFEEEFTDGFTERTVPWN